MVAAKVEMGLGLIKARRKDGGTSKGGSGRGRERSRSAESTTSQGGWHFEAVTSAERGKTKMKLKTWQTGKLKGRVGGRGGAVGASLVNLDPKLFMIKTFSHSCSHIPLLAFPRRKRNSGSIRSCLVCASSIAHIYVPVCYRVAKQRLIVCCRKKTLRMVGRWRQVRSALVIILLG